jgi:DNA-binding MarR family transcriptional regulator
MDLRGHARSVPLVTATRPASGPGPAAGPLTSEDYENLLAFRVRLRQFQHWSRAQARAVGLTPAQHQLLLAVKGHPGGHPTVGDLAGYLLLRHHSTVELIDRAAAAGFVERSGDGDDGRRTRVRLTPDGERRIDRLSTAHLDELRNLAPLLGQFAAPVPGAPAPGPASVRAPASISPPAPPVPVPGP